MTRAAGAALALGVALLGSTLGLAAPAQAAECTTDKTQYVPTASPTLSALGIPQSWQVSVGQGQVVAVVDSGVNTANRHLPADTVVLPGTSFVPGDPEPDGRTDEYGHGTAVAGIIAARPIQGVKSGMYGAAPATRILPVRVFQTSSADPEPGQYLPSGERTAAGIRWAADHGADVINVSLSAPANNTALRLMRSAVQHALARGIVVVASSGDSLSGQADSTDRFPAAFDGVISVAATNADGVVDDYSVHGSSVDVAAPGSNVLVTFHGAGDCQSNATPMTSWAAPFVSALAAQLKQHFPKDTPAQIEYRITSTAQRPVAGSRDNDEGWGLIQPYDALTAPLDARRPGPTAPGQQAAAPARASATEVKPMSLREDPLAPVREQALWWIIGAGGLAALALVLRPLMMRARRSR